MTTTLNMLDEGMHTVINDVSPKGLLDASVIMPFELSSLVLLRLLKDMMKGGKDIAESYRQYMNNLVRPFLFRL